MFFHWSIHFITVRDWAKIFGSDFHVFGNFVLELDHRRCLDSFCEWKKLLNNELRRRKATAEKNRKRNFSFRSEWEIYSARKPPSARFVRICRCPSGASDRLLSFWLMIGAQSAVVFQFRRAIHHRSSGLPNRWKKNSFRADLSWISTINAMTQHKWWIINCEAQWRCHYGVRCSRSG